MESLVVVMGADPHRFGSQLPVGPQRGPHGVVRPVVPGGFGQQPPDVAGAGLGDRTDASVAAGGVLGGERLGNDCDVLHLTREGFTLSADNREPVVAGILPDGPALVGAIPRPRRRKAS